MSSSEPMIKIIPPNPLTHSILIVYCYTNNKTIQCQAKWSRIEPFQQSVENKNSRSMTKTQTGNTYKCTALDFNHIIEVEAVCQFQGKSYTLTAKTQPVKSSKQLLERKNKQKTVSFKISNSDAQIQCTISLQSNKTLLISSSNRQFNLELNSCNVFILSPNCFKGRILSHRYQFLTFFNQCENKKQSQNRQLSLANLFQFTFLTQSDRDLVLFKIAENSTIQQDRFHNFAHSRSKMISSHQQLPPSNINYLQNAQINVDLKQKDISDQKITNTNKRNGDKHVFQYHKKNNFSDFKPSDSKFASYTFHFSPKADKIERNLSQSQRQINQKLKLSEKLIKKNQKEDNQESNSKSHNDINSKDGPKSHEKKSSLIFNDTIKQKLSNQDKQFLNVFEEENYDSQPQNILQSSSPQFYVQNSPKNRPATNFVNSQIKTYAKDLPSINLRGSFEQLEKNIEEPLKIKQKFKTQTCRELSYQYPRNKQKMEILKTQTCQNLQNFTEELLRKSIIGLRKQNQQLKQQNSSLKKQIQSVISLSNENTHLKKKFYQLQEEINRLQEQKKEFFADKMKFQSNFHKERQQKENIKRQLENVIRMLEKNSSQSGFNMQKTERYIRKDKDMHEEMMNRINSQTMKNVSFTKRYGVQQLRNKTPPSKIAFQNQIMMEQSKGFSSNTQSRKELRYQSNSYKYPSSNNNPIHVMRP